MAITMRLHRCVIHLQRPLRGLLLSTEPLLLLLSVEPRILMLENALTPAECEVRPKYGHITLQTDTEFYCCPSMAEQLSNSNYLSFD